MRDYVAPSWRALLENNGLASFDALWELQTGWFEEPNQRRGGWSGVSRVELPADDTGPYAIFLKRQENHKTFSWRHPIQGIPTFLREFRHIMHYRACAVPTLEPVFFGMQRIGNGHRAILATAELTGFAPLEEHLHRWQQEGAPPLMLRRNILEAVASLARTMHDHHIQHNCFYPKHVFIRIAPDNSVEARIIDLEKSRWRPLRIHCILRDLDTLSRHSPDLSRRDRLRFLKAYLHAPRLTPDVRKLWRRLAAKAAQKRPAAA